MTAWYCLITRPQAEASARAWLQQRQVYSFYPVKVVPVHRPRAAPEKRHGTRESLYLPRYLFARFDQTPAWHELFADCRHITNAIRHSNGWPAALHPDDLRLLHDMRSRDAAADAARQAARAFMRGDRARLIAGPLEGQDCEVTAIQSGKVRVTLRLFSSVREVEVDGALLQKVAAQ